MKIFRSAERILDQVSSVISFCGVVIVFLIMFLVSSDVAGRLIFSRPIEGTTEIAQNMTAIVVFMMLPWATRLGQHVRSVMIVDRLPPPGKRAFEIASYLLGIILFIGIMYSSWTPLLRALKLGDYDGEQFRFPLSPVWLALVVCSAFCLLQCIVKIILIAVDSKGEESNRVSEQEVQV
jgi:TRAP-type C4-dicarboxylate transport system permease small subunit